MTGQNKTNVMMDFDASIIEKLDDRIATSLSITTSFYYSEVLHLSFPFQPIFLTNTFMVT